MANTFNTLKNAPGVIAKTAAGIFKDNLVFGKSVRMADEKDWNGMNGYSAGDTLNISKPARFNSGTSADVTSTIEEITEEKAQLVLNIRRNVAVEITSAEFAHERAYDNWVETILKPAAASLASNVENDMLDSVMDTVPNHVGTAGSSVYSPDLILAAKEKQDLFNCPMGVDRFALLSPQAHRSAVNNMKGLFNAQQELSEQFRDAAIGKAFGFNFMSSNLLQRHANGNDVTGINVDGATQTGATLDLQGFTANTGTLTKGTVFTIAGVNAVHPITKEDLGELQQFIVLANGTADANGDIAASIYPAIITSGTTQTVTASPGDTAVVTIVGSASTTYTRNMFYSKDAFVMASVPLIQHQDVHYSQSYNADGYNIRVEMGSNITTDKMLLRLDFLGGIVAARPEWAVLSTN